MASPVPYLSGSETVRRESLLDTLSIRYPAETPLIRDLPHFKLDSTITSYPIDRPFTSSDNVRSPSDPHQNTRMESMDFQFDDAFYQQKLTIIAEINHFAGQISNSDREAIVAGLNGDTLGYRAHQKWTKLLNNIENVLMYGTGSTVTTGGAVGASPGGDERRTLGLIQWAAYSGIERMHATTPATTLTDPYGTLLGSSDFYSVFFNAGGANLTRSMLYNKILATLNRAGGRAHGFVFHVGYKLKNLIADFAVRQDGTDVNKRNVAASDLMTYDDIETVWTPQGTIRFRTNRYLDIEGSTYTIGNTGPGTIFTPGSPTAAGTVSDITCQADETMIGYEPGQVAIGWYRAPQYQLVPSVGDYTSYAAIAEYALMVRHPLSVCGASNLLG